VAVTSIALTDEQLARLREYAKSSGRSLDEVVREAVEAYLANVTEPALRVRGRASIRRR
jgi:predicted DNA-binding protein